LAKIEYVVPEICSRTDRHTNTSTHTQTHTLITTLRLPTGRGVINYERIDSSVHRDVYVFVSNNEAVIFDIIHQDKVIFISSP